LLHFDTVTSYHDVRDRALFGLQLFTGARPSEVRRTKMGDITAYGEMGCWNKGKTKNGEDYVMPVPLEVMAWLEAWLKIREDARDNPYLFPGQWLGQPVTDDTVNFQWNALCHRLKITGLWNYDLRRTMASYLGNELGYSDKVIDAMLNHEDGRSLGHYYHVSFDKLVTVVQHYAEWLRGIKTNLGGNHEISHWGDRISVGAGTHQ
jgi:integrase